MFSTVSEVADKSDRVADRGWRGSAARVAERRGGVGAGGGVTGFLPFKHTR